MLARVQERTSWPKAWHCLLRPCFTDQGSSNTVLGEMSPAYLNLCTPLEDLKITPSSMQFPQSTIPQFCSNWFLSGMTTFKQR